MKCMMLAVMLLALAGAAHAGPRERLLVTPAWLKDHVADSNLVILHAGTEDGYRADHIAGARLAEMAKLSVSTPGGLQTELPPPDVLHDTLAGLGISDRSRIVLYYEPKSERTATRIMVTLDAAGLGARAVMLDGGLAAWKAAGNPLTMEISRPIPSVLSPLKIQPLIVDADYVNAHLKAPGWRVLDARAPEFFSGEQAGLPGSVKGHIPGAHSVPYAGMTKEDGSFKSAAELTAIFRAANVKPGNHVIVYCHIGIQATEVIFAARTLGLSPQLYDGSFQDWSARKLPVENPAAETLAK